MKQFGYFCNEGKEYVITTPETPRHWYNYLFNDNYVTFTSQVGFGEGIAQGALGRRITVVDSRQLYIIDDDTKEYWTGNGLPTSKEYKNFKCIHGIGYTNIESEYKGIQTSFRMFVPQEHIEEIWTVKIKNVSNQIRNIKVIP